MLLVFETEESFCRVFGAESGIRCTSGSCCCSNADSVHPKRHNITLLHRSSRHSSISHWSLTSDLVRLHLFLPSSNDLFSSHGVSRVAMVNETTERASRSRNGGFHSGLPWCRSLVCLTCHCFSAINRGRLVCHPIMNGFPWTNALLWNLKSFGNA